ncbi:hypothetical protein EMPS_08367 [Entomortierella parvispora]|uniref:Uncharacterized protein n=1 Tax=Entomortierella parvispora TaxID=205924 RepID=A0A9P3HFV8_9FUNG|nr:hypothetical protein EMPS_08367 [Entomortierella parvispora]
MADPSANNIAPIEGLQEKLSTLTVAPSAAQASNVGQRRTILDDLSDDDSDDDGDFAPESESDDDSDSDSDSDSGSDSGSEKEDDEQDVQEAAEEAVALTQETAVVGAVDSKVLRTGKTIKVVTESEIVETTVETTAITNE